MTAHIPIVTPDEVIWVPAGELSKHERSVAASHLNIAIGALGGRGTERLDEFRGIRLNGMPLAIDSKDLEALDEGGGFSFDVFYWDDSQ